MESTTDKLDQWKKTLREQPKIANSVVELVGNTPCVKLNKIGKDLGATVIAKLEA